MPQDPKQLLVWALIALLEPADLRNVRKHEGFFSFCSFFACFLFPSPLFAFFPSFLPFFFRFPFLAFISFFLSFFPSFSLLLFLPSSPSLFLALSLFFCVSLSHTNTHHFSREHHSILWWQKAPRALNGIKTSAIAPPV